MSPWVAELGICFGMVLLAIACFQFRLYWMRKVGVWLIFSTLGVAIWFWTGSWIAVMITLLGWFVIPAVRAVVMSQRLRFSINWRLKSGVLDVEEFPELHELTQQARKLGFVSAGDHWLRPSPVEQGFRLMTHREKPIFAAVAVVRQGALSLSYLIFGTPTADGCVWITWDYPLAYVLKMPPNFRVYRYLQAMSVAELFERHEAFLAVNEVKAAEAVLDASKATKFFDRIFKATVNYNLDIGFLRNTEGGSGEIMYSWRGLAFICAQVLREMIKG